MNLLRTDANAWGQEVLLGISWDLLPWFVGAGIVIIVGHVLFKGLWEPAVRHRLERQPGG
ncbi:MAG: hypothetical protein ACREIR_08195 [Geminicoccaceae bacterium]